MQDPAITSHEQLPSRASFDDAWVASANQAYHGGI